MCNAKGSAYEGVTAEAPGSNLCAPAIALGFRLRALPPPPGRTAAPFASPVRARNVGLWSYHPSATSTSTFPSTAATRSRGWSTVHRASTAAVFAPWMIPVSSVRVTDAATRTAGRDTCIHVTSRIHGTRLTATVGKHRLRA